ncbi:UNVERIFIED_CONTAM: hypothetical protein Scaly_1760600 [Sesamum calycinum]|uniref:Uncharacterized protein n=1 Tax=Sesamum calycinum TaxID=2727403 RepID=A0AAW2NW78_9LAMI
MEKSRSFPQSSSEFGFEDRADPYTFNGPSGKGQAFGPSSDPEVKRKKRIAGYNMFTTEDTNKNLLFLFVDLRIKGFGI